MRDRIINIIIWCAALVYLGYRLPTDTGWDYASDWTMIVLVILLILANAFDPIVERRPLSVRINKELA